MNPMTKNLLARYLMQAEEQFSGFDGTDYSNIMQPDDMNATGDLARSIGAPTPYQVTIQNTTAGDLTAILFGKNKYLMTTNYGSATGLVVSHSVSGMTYLELLMQSGDQPFETSLIKVKSSTTNQPTQTITIYSKDANGQQVTIPLIADMYFSANQYQSTLVDIPYNLRVDGNTYLSFTVLANATVYITFFPKLKANLSRQIQGENILKQYSNPNIPIGNTLVVKAIK